MDLQAHIRKDLWQAIESTYLSEHYSHAIVEAWIYIRDLLRSKSGLDGDGQSLIGSALGGDTPKLRLNKFQTETEKNVQRGFEFLLRGFFQGIRSPRSHENSLETKDTKNSADSIIFFANYLIGVLDSSLEQYSISGFIERISDQDFVNSEYYAQLLVNEIPREKYQDTLIEIFRMKEAIEVQNLKLVSREILTRLGSMELGDFLVIVSDELRSVESNTTIIRTFNVISPEMWSQIKEIPRLRIESKLIKSIRVGEVWSNGKLKTIDGALGTWGLTISSYFHLKDELKNTLMAKLEGEDIYHSLYVLRYFTPTIPRVFIGEEINRVVKAIANKIDHQSVKQRLVETINSYPESWQKSFSEALEHQTDITNPAIYLSDGTPFLKLEVEPIEEDEIPF